MKDSSHSDVIVVGAGFGGLGAGLRLAERGAGVRVLEAMSIPGGCASTFRRGGRSFEAGATLFAGLGEDGIFREWIDRHGIDVVVDFPDPVLELRTHDFSLKIPRDRDLLVERLCRLEPRHADGIRGFFDLQRSVADLIWSGLRPELAPPLRWRGLLAHARRIPSYSRLLPLVGRSLESVMKGFGVADVPSLRTFCDEVSQITVQCEAADAEAPFALATLDYFSRGAGHVRGGIGELAGGLAGAIENLGGDVRYKHVVETIRRDGSPWRVTTPRGEFTADHVVANVLPQALARMLGRETAATDASARRVRTGWGACMLYLTVGGSAREDARHLALIDDSNRPLVEGNHVFCSIADEHRGERTVTASTHVDLGALLVLDEKDRGARVAEIQEAMRTTIARRAPELARACIAEMTASPRTFERFTMRPEGYVGGIPRRRGIAAYRGLVRRAATDGVHLVGDSQLPGQSILATAIGGAAVADGIVGYGPAKPCNIELGGIPLRDTIPA